MFAYRTACPLTLLGLCVHVVVVDVLAVLGEKKTTQLSFSVFSFLTAHQERLKLQIQSLVQELWVQMLHPGL